MAVGELEGLGEVVVVELVAEGLHDVVAEGVEGVGLEVEGAAEEFGVLAVVGGDFDMVLDVAAEGLDMAGGLGGGLAGDAVEALHALAGVLPVLEVEFEVEHVVEHGFVLLCEVEEEAVDTC